MELQRDGSRSFKQLVAVKKCMQNAMSYQTVDLVVFLAFPTVYMKCDQHSFARHS